MILTNKQIRLCECSGWSAPSLVTNPQRQVFSHRGPHKVVLEPEQWDSEKGPRIMLCSEKGISVLATNLIIVHQKNPYSDMNSDINMFDEYSLMKVVHR